MPQVCFSFEGRGVVKYIDNFSSNNYQISRDIKTLVHLGIYIFVKKKLVIKLHFYHLTLSRFIVILY